MPTSSIAQPTPPAAERAIFDEAAQKVLAVLQGTGDPATTFTPDFIAAVPPAQLKTVIDGLKAQFGEALSVEAVRPTDARAASIDIRFEQAVVTFTIGAREGRLSGLFITGSRAAVDSLDAVAAEIKALPGHAGFTVHELTAQGSRPVTQNRADERFAIASAFKLYVLAEVDRAVRAGERRWDDVIALSQKSHPSGITQTWPDDAPMTLQTLATLMVSISDNSATDTLIALLGQDRLARIVRASGHSNPGELSPLLTTQQVTGLKMPGNADLRDAFLGGSEREQAAIIAGAQGRLSLPNLDLSVYTGGPNQIDTIEWFASPEDIARLLAILERDAHPVTRAILKNNPGIAPDNARRWAYLG
ncbi:serine hydrolase [Blastomonas sp.]|uniref:serine hydrolase n=1 Tax=Blastomonas sp. TaxID=1909299 RepID=UPI003593AE4B